MAKKKIIVSHETLAGEVGFRASTKTLFFECNCGAEVKIGPDQLRGILPKIQEHLTPEGLDEEELCEIELEKERLKDSGRESIKKIRMICCNVLFGKGRPPADEFFVTPSKFFNLLKPYIVRIIDEHLKGN